MKIAPNKILFALLLALAHSPIAVAAEDSGSYSKEGVLLAVVVILSVVVVAALRFLRDRKQGVKRDRNCGECRYCRRNPGSTTNVDCIQSKAPRYGQWFREDLPACEYFE